MREPSRLKGRDSLMLKIYRRFSAGEWGLVLAMLCFTVTQVWLELTMPDFMSDITMLVQTPGSQLSDIIAAGAKMLGCALGSLAASVMTAIIAARLSSGFAARLRNMVFGRVQSFSMREIGRFSSSSLITRTTNDITHVQMFIVIGFMMLMRAPLMAAWAVLKIADKQWQWTVITAGTVAALMLILGVCVWIALPKFRRMQALTDDLNRVTRENLTGLSVVRAYNAETYQEEKFERANDILTRTSLFTARTMSMMMPSIQLLLSGLSLGIYWVGAVIINETALLDRAAVFSDMIVFSQYAIQVVMAFMMLVAIFIIMPRASVAAGRINEVLDTEPSISDGVRTQGKEGLRGELRFENVSFRYPDAEDDVLQNISFTASQGETVALIGSTGCGKSTVVNLIPRFYDVSAGRVLVDGVDVREYTQKALRDKIGYVSQKAVLFSGTVQSNIAFGEGGSETLDADAVHQALELAQAAEFVDRLPEKEEAFVAQGGSNFSGGQKQRLSIARAVARRPELLIFDDSFSALDYKTDRALRQALREKCRSITKLIVAQRIGTIRDADKIVVLEEGRVAGVGTHQELMQSCEVYQQIALSQLSKEELA